MANEFKHLSVGSEITQAEYEAVGGHVLDSQARGDIIYASSTTQLSRLGVGGAGAVLTSDGTDPVWDTTWSPTGHLIPASDDSYDLGSAAAAWQDLFLEGDITFTDAGTFATSAGALTVNGAAGLNLQEGGSTIIGISDSRALSTTNTASVDLDASGAIQINSSGGALSIGNDNVDQTINIATAGTRTLNIGIGDGTDITTTVVKGTLSVGVDDAGYDVVFYGDTASANMTWDTSVDDLILNGAARIVIPDGQLVLGSTAVSATAAELNLLDGVSGLVQADFTKLAAVDATSTELNLMDGGSSIGTTAVSDGHGIVMNHGGTMAQTTVQTLAAYLDDEITAMPNLTSTGTLTTLTVDNVIVNGTTIGHTSDTDLLTLTSANLAVAGDIEVSGSVEVATIDYTDGDNAITIADGGGVTFAQGVTVTGATTLNGAVTLGSDATDVITINGTVAGADAVVFEGATGNTNETTLNITNPTADATIKLPAMSAGTYFLPVLDTASSVAVSATPDELNILDGATVVVGEINYLDLGSTAVGTAIASKAVILDSNKDYDGLRNLTITGELDAATLDLSSSADIAGDLVLSGGADGALQFTNAGENSIKIPDNQASALIIEEANNAYVTFVTTDSSESVTFGKAVDLGSNTLTTTGSLQVRTIDYSDGDNAITIADGGGTTFAAAVDLGSNTLTSTGSLQVQTIDYSDGDLAMTIADGGGVTFAQDATLTSHKYLNLPENSSIKFTDQIGVDNSIDNDDGQGIIFTFRTGATVTPFSPVYIDGNNEVQECNANAIATMPCIGVSMNTSNVTADNDIEVMMLGLIRHDSFSDFGAAGAPVYASGTAGALTTTAPSGEDDVVQIVGHSIAEDLIFVQPCLTTIEHTG